MTPKLKSGLSCKAREFFIPRFTNFERKLATVVRINITAAIPFAQVNFFEGHTFYSILPLKAMDVFFYSLTSGLALILWAAAYLRLTEKQV